MKLIAIYALREPDTGEIRYIGKATDAMARFKSHMRDARAEAFRELSNLVSTAPSPYKERFEELGRRRFYG